MTSTKIFGLLAIGMALTACAEGDPAAVPSDKSRDRGVNSHALSTMVAGIWVDPNGCEHWIIDDGVEGYMSERMTPDGLPVCSDTAPRETASGPFKEGSPILDPTRADNFPN